MNKKLQVFVSSTYNDLIDERQAAVEAILDAGHIPAGMELFKAGKSQMKTIQKWIDESDVYLLILGGRYGSIEEESGLSYTELEYRYALSKNMPVFAIILNDSFIYTKAASKGKDAILEKDNIDKYNSFIKYVKSNIVRFAKNIDSISSIIHATLNDMMSDPDYLLVGWVKSNKTIDNLQILSDVEIHNSMTHILRESLSRFYPIDVTDFSNTISTKLSNSINTDGLLDSVQRIVELEPNQNGMVKVTTTSILNYIYLNKNHQKFGVQFEATKQQSETFKVEKLLINETDYTSQFICETTLDANRGQLIYRVQSKESIEIADIPCNIYYKCSYTCPTLDFYQAYRLPFPCRNFSVNVFLKTYEQFYSILASTFSSFSEVHSDDYLASEMKNFGFCNLTLPTWSLSGAGYVITLKNKSKENHI